MDVFTKQQRIATLGKRFPERCFTSLHHYLDTEWLTAAYRTLNARSAPGVDGVAVQEYGRNLTSNLEALLGRVHQGRYRAACVKRGWVAKGSNPKGRPIGMPTTEDKVLQRGVKMILEPLYEPLFRDCSYGFRPGRSPHMALEALWRVIMRMGGGWVLDVDVCKFFDTLDQYDAERVQSVLPKRFGKYGLRLHATKTQLVDFRPANKTNQQASFQFLGFTHFWGRSRRGHFVVKRQTASVRLTRSIRSIRPWCRQHRHRPVCWQQAKLVLKVRGHYLYYGITGNIRSLNSFYEQVRRTWRYWLNRRTRGRSMSWHRFESGVLKHYPLPPPRIYHSYAKAKP